MSTQLVIRIPEQQKLMLETLANSKNVSVAAITRLAIKNYVAKATNNKEDLMARLARIGKSKKISNPPKDLSKNYKKYLLLL